MKRTYTQLRKIGILSITFQFVKIAFCQAKTKF